MKRRRGTARKRGEKRDLVFFFLSFFYRDLFYRMSTEGTKRKSTRPIQIRTMNEEEYLVRRRWRAQAPREALSYDLTRMDRASCIATLLGLGMRLELQRFTISELTLNSEVLEIHEVRCDLEVVVRSSRRVVLDKSTRNVEDLFLVAGWMERGGAISLENPFLNVGEEDLKRLRLQLERHRRPFTITQRTPCGLYHDTLIDYYT